MNGQTIEYFPSILYIPSFGIHVNEIITHKNIKLKTILTNLSLNMPTLFKPCSSAATSAHAFKTPRKMTRSKFTPS
jgi:hypothetical protein